MQPMLIRRVARQINPRTRGMASPTTSFGQLVELCFFSGMIVRRLPAKELAKDKRVRRPAEDDLGAPGSEAGVRARRPRWPRCLDGLAEYLIT